MNLHIGVICASGIGDALILHTASHHLQKAGFSVTTFSDFLPSFGAWLKDYHFQAQPHSKETFSSFDALFLQYDNSPKAKEILSLRKSGKIIYTLYGDYRASKHLPLDSTYDFVFDEEKTVLENVRLALHRFFPTIAPSKDNGMKPPPSLLYRRYRKRIAIHPESKDPAHSWSRRGYLLLADRLKAMGYEPVFLASEPGWRGPFFPRLEDLASFLYECGFFIGNSSGPSHLASCLRIPNLVISKGEQHLARWAPDWLPGLSITPSFFLPNFKGMRWRDTKWQSFISVSKVINKFKLLEKLSN